VNELVDRVCAGEALPANAPRAVVVDAVREVLDEARARDGTPPDDGWESAAAQRVAERQRPTLVPVINSTGVVLHTNLGRAPLPAVAVRAIEDAAGYTALEYDLVSGRRGSRQTRIRRLLREVTGAEDALVVNNAAAAVILVLNTLAAGAEAIVSRGELVEIGGSFRIPEIIARSGCALVEVGATNRTHLRDYERALSPRTRCALKVHRSNFSMTGFTSDVALADLARFMHARDIPVVHDLGSGLLLDLSAFGLRGEPRVTESVSEGAVVIFSGDKLVGGPQAGLIAGPAALLTRMAANPLARALRPDKVVLAALEATLALYRDPEQARREIPVLAMLTTPPEGLEDRARRMAAHLPGSTVGPGWSSVGGGSFPDTALPTTLVRVPVDHPQRVLAALRDGSPPVVARTEDDAIVLDPRTLTDQEADRAAARLAEALAAMEA